MNEATFNISIKDASLILKKMKFLKRRKEIGIGVYSSASLDSVKLGDLKKIHQTAIDNNDYELLLDDDSIFQFSKDGDKLRYAFIQSQSAYFSFTDFLLELFDEEDIPIDEQVLEEMKVDYAEDYEQRRDEQKINVGAMYIRYDVDRNGYRPNLHSYAHIHIGLNNSFRLPSAIILTPLSFVLFVIRHVYISRWEIAINENIINEHIFQFKKMCKNIPEELWQMSEQRELYVV